MVGNQTLKNKILIWILPELVGPPTVGRSYKNLFCGILYDLFVGGYENQYHHDFA